MSKNVSSNPTHESIASAGTGALREGWAQAYVEAAVDAVILIDERGAVRYMNPAACRLFGYDSGECIGRNVSMFMDDPFRSAHDGYLARYLREGGPRIIGIGRAVEARRRDGAAIPVYLSVCEASMDGARMFVGSIHDMSEQTRAERDKDTALLELNTRNLELTCLMRIGEALRHMDSPARVLESIASHVPSAYPVAGVASCRIRFDGEVYTSRPFADSQWCLWADILVAGRTRGLIEVYFRDAAESADLEPVRTEAAGLLQAIARMAGEAIERREAEAQVIQASKLASIGELAAGVGHEINNPVNGIVNCADILLETLAEGTQERQFAELIRSEADRITRIVRNLLTFSRQDREAFASVAPRELVDVVLSLSAKRIRKSDIELTTAISPDLPPLICRPERMQQVLMNLIINAVHALDAKYPERNNAKRLAISAEACIHEGRPHLHFRVADRGCGIDPVHLERIFDPFFTTKGRDKGTGLGLSISHSIVKEHGGALRVDSEQGYGSTFHVYVPVGGPPKSADGAADRP